MNDIKALVTLVYNRVSSKFVSLRCNEDDSEGGIEYDAYDRPTGDDEECKDTNPGTLHILLANYLGIKGQSFVEDRTFDDEVWNQPLRKFEVTQQKEVTAVEANEIVGVPAASYAIEEFEGRLETNDWHHQDPYDVEAGWKIKVELSGTNNADLFVRFGSPPTSEENDCKKTSDDSEETCYLTTPEGESKLYISVKGVSEEDAKFVVTANLGNEMGEVPQHYLFNDVATKFYHMRTRVEYITESSSTTDGNLGDRIDQYTKTDTYNYILELNDDGEIIGGEWVGYSKKNHPDFLWLPTGRRDYPIAGGAIDYDKVKEILDMSLAGVNDEEDPETPEEESEIPPQGGPVELERTGEVDADGWEFYGPFEATEGSIKVSMYGNGDADLYIKKDENPSKDNWDCRPYKSGTVEDCNMLGPAKFYIGVYGTKKSEYSIDIKFTAPPQEGFEGPAPSDETEGGPVSLKETGSVEAGEWMSFGPYVHTDGAFEVVMNGTGWLAWSGDADLYVKAGSQPSEESYDCRPYEEGSSESCTLEGPGTYYVGVRGFKKAKFELAISYFSGPAGANTDTGETTEDGTIHLDLNSQVAKGEMKYYQVPVTEGQRVEVQTTAEKDIDLYVKMNMLPTEDVYDARSFSYSGNEKVTYLPTADGTLHIGVYGFEASDFNLKTSNGE